MRHDACIGLGMHQHSRGFPPACVVFPPPSFFAHASAQVAAKLPLLGGPGLELRAASYAAVVADLNQADWPTKLQAAGWDPSIPTVWVAEGLTYYLEEASLKALIQVGWVLKHQDHMG